jgi:hypothetical protein
VQINYFYNKQYVDNLRAKERFEVCINKILGLFVKIALS